MNKLKKFIIVIFCLLFCSVNASEKTFITDNYDGKIIFTPEYIISIQDYDIAETIIWLPADDIVITNNGYVVNLNSGSKAEIESINWR